MAALKSGRAYGRRCRTVKSCVGGGELPATGQQDSVQLYHRPGDCVIAGYGRTTNKAGRLEGCARECARRAAGMKMIATEGWNLYVAGENGGATPKRSSATGHGDLDRKRRSSLHRPLSHLLHRTADRLQRTAPSVESRRLDHVRGWSARTRWVWPRNSEAAINAMSPTTSASGRACWRDQTSCPGSFPSSTPPMPSTRPVTFTSAGRKVPVSIGTRSIKSPGGQRRDCDLLNDIQVWTACAYDHLIPGRGVGVLLDDGSQVALFRLDDGSVHAVGNVDPFSGAAVMSAASSVIAEMAPCNRRSKAGFRARRWLVPH